MLIHVPTNGEIMCISTSTQPENYLNPPSSEEEHNHNQLRTTSSYFILRNKLLFGTRKIFFNFYAVKKLWNHKLGNCLMVSRYIQAKKRFSVIFTKRIECTDNFLYLIWLILFFSWNNVVFFLGYKFVQVISIEIYDKTYCSFNKQ